MLIVLDSMMYTAEKFEIEIRGKAGKLDNY